MIETEQAGQGAMGTKRAYWGQRITEWERSGQTQKAFCAERGLVASGPMFVRSSRRKLRPSMVIAILGHLGQYIKRVQSN
jgi:hypothetical protein